jgi:hypothetical protein
MKLWVIIFDRCEQFADAYPRCQFLPNFSTQSHFRRFARLHLPAGKLPPVFPFAITTLRGKDPVAIADNGCHHLNMFPLIHTLHYPIALDAIAYRLLANIETVGIYLVQFLLKEAIDNLVIDSSRDIRVWHSCMIKMIVA